MTDPKARGELGLDSVADLHERPGYQIPASAPWRCVKRPDEVERLFRERVRSNAEISRLDCLMLHQRLSLVGKAPDLCADLGFVAKRSFAQWARTLTKLRDTLAHGGGLLHARPDPVEAIELFDEVRAFAERVWEVAESK